jgi:hypothetical protein
VVGFTIGSRGKVPGKTSEKRIRNNNNNKNNNNSINLLTCLTTAKYGQLQPSTKTTVQV